MNFERTLKWLAILIFVGMGFVFLLKATDAGSLSKIKYLEAMLIFVGSILLVCRLQILLPDGRKRVLEYLGLGLVLLALVVEVAFFNQGIDQYVSILISATTYLFFLKSEKKPTGGPSDSK